MEQNDTAEEVKETKNNEGSSGDNAQDKSTKETKNDEEIGWDDVQEEMKVSAKPVEKKEVNSVKFDEIKQGKTKEAGLDLDFILDIPLTVTVELGRGKMLISELLKLGQSSVIELTKSAGEPMDVFVNNRLIARGEVVVVDDRFGVRLTDIVSPAERLDKLK
ncbi:MAG: flagellar motor switch protein FliN [Deltaproteobacteria bacterium]|nr:flagellar motor switch protein FliN [Deltaproteobacteria bacterium]